MTDRELAILIRRTISLAIIVGGAALAWWVGGWPAALTYFLGMLATPAVVIVWFFWMPRRIW